MMAGIPDLVAPTGYDAMAGNPSPETQQALAGDSLFAQSMNQVAPVAFTSIAHQPAKKSTALAGGR
jgi:hypothetical protein